MPVQLVSDKYLQAERRNRLERSRLDVTCKHYDRETTRLNFEIDREKRFIKNAFRTVVKTSGTSEAGIPPKDEKDTDFEKCPSYRQGLRLSNKRLLEWRDCEKQLEKFIQNHEKEIAKAQKKRPVSAKSTKSDKKEEISGADIDNDVYNDDVFVDEDALSTTTSVDPMNALKDDPVQEKDFSVKNWEKDIIESYKKMVGRTVSAPVTNKNDNAANSLRSKSSPAIITTASDLQRVKAVRPHTAQVRRRPPSGKSLPPRPSSAQVTRHTDNNAKQFLITKDSIFIKSGNKFEKLVDNRPVEKPVMVNNYIDTLTPGTSNLLSSSLTSINSLCPVQEGDEEGDQNEDKVDHGTEDNENNQEESLQNKSTNHQLLKKAVQKWKRTKSERMHSSASSISDKASRNALLHSNSDLSSYVESIRRLKKDSTFKQSNSDLSTYVESGRRTRHDSESASSRISLSSHLPSASLGIPADIEDISNVQEKLASEITAERPVAANKLVAVTTVVKAAMTFSRTARKRALAKMVEENSAEPHEIIRQERLKRLQSRQNILKTIANQWNDNSGTIIEAVE